jgi:hypothetical protein
VIINPGRKYRWTPQRRIRDGLQDKIATVRKRHHVTHVVTAGFLEFGREPGDPHRRRNALQNSRRKLATSFTSAVPVRNENDVHALKEPGELGRKTTGVKPAGQ